MSYWSYVNGVIEVNVYGRTQPEMNYILSTVLEHLPYVTGSEKNMNVHTVMKSGCNGWSTHNEFGEAMFFRPLKARSKHLETQSIYLVVVEGYLRDRQFMETLKEFNKWLNRLAKRILVEDVVVKITGQNKSIVISNPVPYRAMFEHRSKDHDTPADEAWTDYLMWERIPGNELPLKLYAKYFETREIDEELERRDGWFRSLDR